MNQTWLITGCSTGLGRSIAFAVLRRGWNAIVTARHTETLAAFQAEFPDTALVLPLDVTDRNAICNAVQAAKDRFGTIDVLVNNAGYGYRAAVEEGEDEAVNRLFATNFFGPVDLIKAVLPDMRAQRRGAIVNVSSVAALETAPGSGYYGATKCALEGMSSGLLKEVGPLGIKVMVVEPGAFRTDFAGRSLTQAEHAIADYAETAGQRRIEHDDTHGTQPGDPDKGAELILDAVSSENTPFRLLLGSDAAAMASRVYAARMAENNTWRVRSCGTDFKK